MIEIKDNTILEVLEWQRFDRSGKSYEVACNKYNAILGYVFGTDLDISNYAIIKDKIAIHEWHGGGGAAWFEQKRKECSFRGIKLSFYDQLECQTRFRLVGFKGTAKDFRAGVLCKFGILKEQKERADNKYSEMKSKEEARAIEIVKLQKIASKQFAKNQYKIRPTISGLTHLTLDIHFDTTQALIDYVNNFMSGHKP